MRKNMFFRFWLLSGLGIINVVESSDAILFNSSTYTVNCLGLNQTKVPKYLVYPDSSKHSVLIPASNWATGYTTGAVAYILLSEALGYATALLSFDSFLDDTLVDRVAGCREDGSCDSSRPALHFTIQSWMLGSLRAEILPDNVRPLLLSVLDFSVDDSLFLWQDVCDAAADAAPPLLLDDYRYYDADRFAPARFFDSLSSLLQLLPDDLVVPCDAWLSPAAPAATRVNLTRYAWATGDSARTGCGSAAPAWLSPACRARPSACVPTLIQVIPHLAARRVSLSPLLA